MSTLRVVQIGCGYWGPNVLRNLAAHPQVELAGVVDIDPDIRAWLADHYPGVPFAPAFDVDLLDQWDAQAVVIATPARTHFSLAGQVVKSGRHCLVEKPLAMTAVECDELINLAQASGVVLMPGHTFLYNAAVTKMKEIIRNGELGEVYYAHAQRLNLGRIRQDVDVVWNLAPHDISILIHWFGRSPKRVAARGATFIQPGVTDIAFLDLEFPDGQYASIHVSWLDPHKTRRITLVGSKKMAVYDDVAENKLTIYDKGVDRAHPEEATLGRFEDFGTFQLRLRGGGVTIPPIDFIEPLRVEVAEFVSAIRDGREPLTNGVSGLQTVLVLEAASRSMKLDGQFVKVGGSF